jgi:hypothetical protein
MIQRHTPIKAVDIWTGMAMVISFSTPDNDVYVEFPVKFRVIKLNRVGIINNHAATDGIFPNEPGLFNANNRNIAINGRLPQAPLTENARPGSHGKSRGGKIVPARYVMSTIRAATAPRDRILFSVYIPVPNPDSNRKPAAAMKKYFAP